MLDKKYKKYMRILFVFAIMLSLISIVPSIWLLLNASTDKEITLLLMSIPCLIGTGFVWANLLSKDDRVDASAAEELEEKSKSKLSESEIQEKQAIPSSNKKEIVQLILSSLPLVGLIFCVIVGLRDKDYQFVSQAAIYSIPWTALLAWQITDFFYGKRIMELAIEADELEEKLKSYGDE